MRVRTLTPNFLWPATYASRLARTRGWANPKSARACIREAEVPSVSRIWSVAAARSKSFSVPAISTPTLRSATDTSTVRFQTPNWTASSTRSRDASHLSTGALSRRRRISSTRFRCHPPTTSSAPSTLS
jgi:hypothetical protein